ncbi:L-glyceraldehyde 3-phosphate reductase [Victivallis sp. Marseille-Q1083]|uniref:L-glyceraldehyde 3-phosphate reductase n=1 Tax=Victivallis sp. Marseille-Q1083 TaxID=2717288 RepID=UPI001589CF26
MMYQPAADRYDSMPYRRCGASGLKLPAISLGMWHNFGSVDVYENARAMLQQAFDLGITHFDLANNYGPEPGSAETTFGQIFRQDFRAYRDEMIISTKAGYLMWPGPYGEWGSRKNLIASCDQSLKRMQLDYVDIFYSHRPDPDTPLEETMGALDQLVRSGKTLYVGISSYPPELTRQAARLLREMRTPFIIHQPRYNLFCRDFEFNGLFDTLLAEKIGCIVFSPLAQGLLTDKYLHGIPANSRASRNHFLKESMITGEVLQKIGELNQLAQQRGQTLAQMAISFVLHQKAVTSALIGAHSPQQLVDIAGCLNNLEFSTSELASIDAIVGR